MTEGYSMTTQSVPKQEQSRFINQLIELYVKLGWYNFIVCPEKEKRAVTEPLYVSTNAELRVAEKVVSKTSRKGL